MASLKCLAIFLCSILVADAVSRDNFKTCDQSSFCRRCRKVEPGKTPYKVLPDTVAHNNSVLYGELFNKDTGVYYILHLTAIEKNNFRLHINEKSPLHGRYEVQDALQGPPKEYDFTKVEKSGDKVTVDHGPNQAVIYYDPFQVNLYSNSKLVISANARGLMRFEHIRTKPEEKTEPQEVVEEPHQETYPGDGADNDPGAWEENYKSHQDSKPYGPEAIALDFSFPGSEHVYGIPQHADSFALKSTKGSDPYRLYNLDVFEYEINEKMALYGSIPVMFAHGKERTSGVFWHNAAETWVDIQSSADNNVVESIVNFVAGVDKKYQVDAHFMSESGVIDVFFLLGPKPLDAFQQYALLTGTAPLPQMFTLGYHQSRWNYNDQEDVAQVVDKFDMYNIPLDVMWLDIEYTDNKKYFTWDPHKFPQPLEMVKNLTNLHRKLVVIIDPHIKRDNSYFVHNDATAKGYYVKHANGKDYEGWCWPGSSSYLDYFNPEVRDYFKEQYQLDKFPGTTNDVYIWNDMNEPSVFNGPEITMPKDLIHYGNWEHRDVHNIFGLMYHSVTYDALYKRSGGTLRPFVLTRSHFAGSQRTAAVWTGDNAGEWEHLRISFPMCLSSAVAGMSFCGADIGGFFKNPDSQLLIRWYQAAVWLPFFRQHSHLETRRREPWLFDEKTLQLTREAINMRYSFLPFWYTLFREHEVTGNPIIRPLWTHYPADEKTYNIDDHMLIGDSILVRSIHQPSIETVNVYFPGDDLWFDVNTLEMYATSGEVQVPVKINKIPVFQRGGTIIPRKMRVRRSTVAMKNDPYSLFICLDNSHRASGQLYIDDETSFKYRYGNYIHLQFTFTDNVLTSQHTKKVIKYHTKSTLEFIAIANPPENIKYAKLTAKNLDNNEILPEQKLEVQYNPYNNVLIIRKPNVSMNHKWTIELIH